MSNKSLEITGKQVGSLIQALRIIGMKRARTKNSQAHVEFGFRVQRANSKPQRCDASGFPHEHKPVLLEGRGQQCPEFFSFATSPRNLGSIYMGIHLCCVCIYIYISISLDRFYFATPYERFTTQIDGPLAQISTKKLQEIIQADLLWASCLERLPSGMVQDLLGL